MKILQRGTDDATFYFFARLVDDYEIYCFWTMSGRDELYMLPYGWTRMR